MSPAKKTRIVCIADTHNATPKLPWGDILIHAGDLTKQGSHAELMRATAWLRAQPHSVKIVVAGNHELSLDNEHGFFEANKHRWRWGRDVPDPRACRELLEKCEGVTYLEHSAARVKVPGLAGGREVVVFGSPYSPAVCEGGRWAFQYEEAEAEDLWEAVPEGVDIVVTHTPARGLCDETAAAGGGGGGGDARVGCEALRRRLGVVGPWLSVCGHLHGGRGACWVCWGCGKVVPWEGAAAGSKRLERIQVGEGRCLGCCPNKGGRGSRAATRQWDEANPTMSTRLASEAASGQRLDCRAECGGEKGEGSGWPGSRSRSRSRSCPGANSDSSGAVGSDGALVGVVNAAANERGQPIVVDVVL